MRKTTFAITVALAGLLTLVSDATAGWRHCEPNRALSSYTVFKAGGYGLDTVDPQDDLDSGWFLGAEVGAAPSEFVEFGFTADWFRRRDRVGEIVVLDSPYGLPIESYEAAGTSTDLVPLGGLVRVRFPVSNGKIVPFVSGALTWDILRLAYSEVSYLGNEPVLTEVSDYFHGPGATLALGVEVALDSNVGLLFEAGAHGSEPSRDLLIDGVPVRGHVVADGDFARLGLRVAFP